MNKIKIFKSKATILLILIIFITMLIFPQVTYKGARSGLLLWFMNILPTLLPFVIISNLMIQLNITKQISRFLYPVFGRLFRISPQACYPLLIGFISGIPMGAKASSDMVAQEEISLEEGNFLFTMCNNYSPIFIMSYIAVNQLKLPQIRYPLFIIIFASSIASAMLYRSFQEKKSKGIIHTQSISSSVKEPVKFNFTILDNVIMNGFEIITKVGGYIILFSILAQLLNEIAPGNGIIKTFLMGLLEITTGISQICKLTINNKIKIVLVALLTSFGGLSGIAQTKSVLGDTRLSMKSYIIVKLLAGIIAFFLAFIYVSIFPIIR